MNIQKIKSFLEEKKENKPVEEASDVKELTESPQVLKEDDTSDEESDNWSLNDLEDEEDEIEEDEEYYDYTVEVEMPCFLRMYVTTNKRMSTDELANLIEDTISSEQYINGTAGVYIYDDSIEDAEIETLNIDTDYIETVDVKEGKY